MTTEESRKNETVTPTGDGSSAQGNDHAVCDNCNSNFACSRLYMSLKIAETEYFRMPKNSRRYKEVTEKLAEVKSHLAQQGWAYPNASRPCNYAVDIKETWKELEKVIELIRSMPS